MKDERKVRIKYDALSGQLAEYVILKIMSDQCFKAWFEQLAERYGISGGALQKIFKVVSTNKIKNYYVIN